MINAKTTPFTNMVAKRTSNLNKILKIIVPKDLEPDNILKIFLNFTNFEPHHSQKIYSYKKERVFVLNSLSAICRAI